MIKNIISRFKGLNPFIQGLASLLTIIVIIGGFNKSLDTSSQKSEPTINETDYNSRDKKVLDLKENNTAEKKPTIESQYNSTKDNTKPKELQKAGLFNKYPIKNSSKKTVSFFITKNGKIDSKTSRFISNSVKRLYLNSPQLFDEKSLIYFNDFMSPSQAFLNHHEINNYLDYYFICDITPLETKKISGMDTFTSSLNIEGYLVNTKNNNSISFPYKNIKGAGFSSNDADLNVTQDLEKKLLNFIKVNI